MAISSMNSASLSALYGTLGTSGISSPSLLDIVSFAINAQQNRKTQQSQPSDQASALKTLYEKVGSLQSSAKELNNKGGLINNRFSTFTATSASSSLVSAKVSAGAAAGGGPTATTYALSATQIAKTQINEGASLNDTADNFGNGAKTFTITPNGGAAINIGVNIGAGDNNLTILTNTANAINGDVNASKYVKASVVSDPGLGTSRLVMESVDTGTTHGFAITGTAGYIGAGGLGVTGVTQAAQDLNYRVNGVSATSTSNTVYLDNAKVEAKFLNITAGAEVNVDVAKNTTNVKDGIEQFVESYNDLQDYLGEYGGYFNSRISSSISQIAKVNKSKLSDIGVSVDTDGKLSISDTTLSNALSNDFTDLEDAFGGLSGVATRVDLLSQTLRSTPSHEILSKLDTRDYNGLALDIMEESFLGSYMYNLFG